jgi:hypothetical protein
MLRRPKTRPPEQDQSAGAAIHQALADSPLADAFHHRCESLAREAVDQCRSDGIGVDHAGRHTDVATAGLHQQRIQPAPDQGSTTGLQLEIDQTLDGPAGVVAKWADT